MGVLTAENVSQAAVLIIQRAQERMRRKRAGLNYDEFEPMTHEQIKQISRRQRDKKDHG